MLGSRLANNFQHGGDRSGTLVLGASSDGRTGLSAWVQVWSTVPLRKRGLEHVVPYIKLTSGSLQNEYALVRIAIIVACTHGWYLHYAPASSFCVSITPARASRLLRAP
jgi:hypothetical protein